LDEQDEVIRRQREAALALQDEMIERGKAAALELGIDRGETCEFPGCGRKSVFTAFRNVAVLHCAPHARALLRLAMRDYENLLEIDHAIRLDGDCLREALDICLEERAEISEGIARRAAASMGRHLKLVEDALSGEHIAEDATPLPGPEVQA